jgi:hypothetical protein
VHRSLWPIVRRGGPCSAVFFHFEEIEAAHEIPKHQLFWYRMTRCHLVIICDSSAQVIAVQQVLSGLGRTARPSTGRANLGEGVDN